MSLPEAPPAEARSEARILAALKARLPGYLDRWAPGPGSPAAAVQAIFARWAATVARALAEARPRGQLAFLDFCGESLRPAQAAEVPLVFTLSPQSPGDAPLPAGAAVAVRAGAGEGDPLQFSVAQAIAIARARLAAVYSLDPASDRWDDHTPFVATGFIAFQGGAVLEHAIYLGHDTLFRLPAGDPSDADGDGPRLALSFELAEAAGAVRENLRLRWEYLASDGFRPLAGRVADMLITDGVVELVKEGGPAAAPGPLLGITSCWIRGVLAEPLPPGGSTAMGVLPRVRSGRASLGYRRTDLPPDAAFVNATPLDTTAPFLPFGARPVQGTTFLLACDDAFGRPGARLVLRFAFVHSGNGAAASPAAAAGAIAWEYFDGSGWRALGVEDTTGVFAQPSSGGAATAQDGIVTFLAPDGWKPCTVGRASHVFVRARLDGEAVFGTAGHFSGTSYAPDLFTPPRVRSVTVSFTFLTDPTPVDHCLTSNGGVTLDRTSAARSTQASFEPFQPVADPGPALYLGFDGPLPAGLVSLYLDVPPDPAQDLGDHASPFVWEYASPAGWSELRVRDETLGLRTSGLLQFVCPFDLLASPGPGGSLYRIRARLKAGATLAPVPVGGIWMNGVRATQEARYGGEQLGRATGVAGQTLSFPASRTPVLEGELVELGEWSGSDRGFETVAAEAPPKDRRLVYDPLTGRAAELWVRWRARPHLLDAGPGERVFSLDRASGLLRFGGDGRGLCPPAGAPVVASYSSGGTARANVPAGSVTELRAAIPFVAGVTNPRPAQGGADTETIAEARRRGPERLRHRDRGLAARDLEWLSLQASPAVARARCLPLVGPGGAGQAGWVTVMIAPHGSDPRPQPDGELLRRVRAYLAARVPAALAGRILVTGPRYRPVDVLADVACLPDADPGAVEEALRAALDGFLHPLLGGVEGLGWPMGAGVAASKIAALLEATPGVDFTADLRLQADGSIWVDEVPGLPDTLAASGGHELRLSVGGGA